MYSTSQLVRDYVELLWNQQQFDQLPRLLHPQFHDHSLPPALPPTAAGLTAWIAGTGISFQHHTFIDEQVTEGEKAILKIRMRLTHIREWRGIPATHRTVEVVGYRCFRVENGQIREQWALLAGNALEEQLTATPPGCKTQE